MTLGGKYEIELLRLMVCTVYLLTAKAQRRRRRTWKSHYEALLLQLGKSCVITLSPYHLSWS